MRFPPQGTVAAGISLDVYVETGTMVDADTPGLNVEGLIPQMTHTVTAKEGDKLKIFFGCSCYGTGVDASDLRITYRIKVNGAIIEPDKYIWNGSYYMQDVGADIVRFYEVPADGDYIITVTWEDTSASATPGFRIPGNRRQMIIQHFH